MRRAFVLAAVLGTFPAATVGMAATHTTVYKDAVGDGQPGHGDIAVVAVSDVRGVVSLTADVRGLRDTAVLELKPRVLGRAGYALSFGASGTWTLEYQNRQGTLTDVSRLPGLAFSHRGHVYRFTFGHDVLHGARVFFFELHIDTAVTAHVSDWAPNGDYTTRKGWWKYALTSPLGEAGNAGLSYAEPLKDCGCLAPVVVRLE